MEGLTKNDISGNTISISGKTGGRLVPISPSIRGMLESSETHYLFPRRERFTPGNVREPYIDQPLNVANMQQRIRRVFHRAGLYGLKSGPHTLRHSAATIYIDNGGDVFSLQRILGHSNTLMTERYVHLSMASIVQNHREFGVMTTLMHIGATKPLSELPNVTLPESIIGAPLIIDSEIVQFFMVQERTVNHFFYYLKARAGNRRWTVLRLGTDIRLDLADAYRLAVQEENLKRMELVRS